MDKEEYFLYTFYFYYCLPTSKYVLLHRDFKLYFTNKSILTLYE